MRHRNTCHRNTELAFSHLLQEQSVWQKLWGHYMRIALFCIAPLILTACTSERTEGQEVVNEAESVTEFSRAPSVVQPDAYALVNLPRGVSVQLPRNWIAVTQNTRTTIDAASEALSIGLDADLTSELPFAANLYDDAGRTVALLNIRYYPEMDVSQTDIRAASAEDISYVNAELHASLTQAAGAGGFEIVSWEGTRRMQINGNDVLLTEYRRAFPGQSVFRVRLVRVLDNENSFTVTVSYKEDLGRMLEPITSYVISTIRNR